MVIAEAGRGDLGVDVPRAGGSTCVLVARERPGFTTGTVHDKLGDSAGLAP